MANVSLMYALLQPQSAVMYRFLYYEPVYIYSLGQILNFHKSV